MKTPPICIFSKHLQFIEDFDELGRTCKAMGLDGVDLPVRRGGHVLPENVAEDLPRAVESIRAAGVGVPMITTRLVRGSDPDARPILEAASKLGVRYFRVGGQKYADTGNPAGQLAGFTEELRGLAQLAEEFGLVAGYHNHSGYDNVGAPLWDLERMFTAISSEALGSNLDAGHAKVEGAYGAWEVNARLIAPWVRMMAVKDFVWDGDRPRWTPLGQGVVPLPEMLAIVRKHGFSGPISIHIEYDTPSHEALLEEIRRAVTTIRAALKTAGYALG